MTNTTVTGPATRSTAEVFSPGKLEQNTMESFRIIREAERGQFGMLMGQRTKGSGPKTR